MWIPARPLVPFLVAALLATACTGNNPTPPLVVVAGWSWDPDLAGDRPLPVIWSGSSTPALLPLLTGGDCPASGSVQAMAVVNGVATLAGISTRCSGADQATMLPAIWSADATGTFAVQGLRLPDRSIQGTALAVATQDTNTFVGGAVGVESPYPMVWKNGNPALAVSGTVLPDGFDSGIVTSIQPGENFVVAGGILHVTGSSPPAFAGVLWILDPDFTSVIPHLIPVPAEAAGATFGSSVGVEIVGTTILSVSTLTTGAGVDKPVVWSDDVPLPLAGLDFTTGPYGTATASWLVGGLPYVSGYVRPFPPGKFPAPAIWASTTMQRLSTADPALGWGAAEALAIRFEHAYVAGETYRNVSSGGPLLSVPAWWDNGSRHDLAGLVPSGLGPAVSQPLFGWWRVPGTPMTSPPDWPYVGGFAEVAAAPAAVAAAGSGVAKVIGLVPKK